MEKKKQELKDEMDARVVLNNQLKKEKKGGNIMFYKNPNQLLKKLELIVGERLAGNTSIKMRNTGVNILDLLLKDSVINRKQHEKIYKTIF